MEKKFRENSLHRSFAIYIRLMILSQEYLFRIVISANGANDVHEFDIAPRKIELVL